MTETDQNPYRLIRLLARGVSGDVFRARRISDERIVAVKVFHRSPREAHEFASAMVRSAFRAKEFRHPSSVEILECVSLPDKLLLASELVDGEVLARVLQRNTRLPAKTVLAVLKRSAETLSRASSSGLVHGRLSPAKMFVDEAGRLRIIGIGLHPERPSFEPPHPAGYTWPPHYTAPEVLDGAAPSEASDVYSLGATAFHLLTGSSPFTCERLPALKIEKVSPVEWPQEIAASTEPGLLLLIERMVSPAREARPSWMEVLDEIKSISRPKNVRTAPRVRRSVPEEAAVSVSPSDEEPAPPKESPFLLPILLALLFLVTATAVLLKTALQEGPSPAGTPAAEQAAALPRKPKPAPEAAPTPPPERPAPEKSPDRTEETPPPSDNAPPTASETAERLLSAIEETEKSGSVPPATLVEEYERLASRFPATPAAVKARMAAARIRAAEEKERRELLSDLKKRTEAALADLRPADALAECEELLRQKPGLKDVKSEKDRIVQVIPSLFSRISTSAELYAARGDYAAAVACYNKVMEHFPPGEWQAEAALAVKRLMDLQERRNAQEEAARREKAARTSRSAYRNALKNAWNSAAAFDYQQAKLILENASAAIQDASLKRALNLYREAVDYEEKFFETVNRRLLNGEREVVLLVPGDKDSYTVASIAPKGVELRSMAMTRVVYPWSRLTEYQHLRLFQMCLDETNAAEWLGLAGIAFHRKLYSEADDKLSKVTSLGNGRLADTAAALRSLFEEMRPLLAPPRARKSRLLP